MENNLDNIHTAIEETKIRHKPAAAAWACRSYNCEDLFWAGGSLKPHTIFLQVLKEWCEGGWWCAVEVTQ